MPKKKFKKQKKFTTAEGLIVSDNQDRRALFKKIYLEKYFNKFLSQFEFKGLDYQAIAYIMRKFWAIGTVACGKDKMDGTLFFAPWVPNGVWNNYNYPVGIRFINVRNVSYIPASDQILDQEACIGYIQKDRKGIYELIAPLIDKLVDIEMTIYVNLKAVKNPLVVGVSPEDEAKKEEIVNQIDEDNPYIFMGLRDISIAKAFVSGANYNIDKLEQERQLIDSQILTAIGINNVGVLEKKEHLTVNEVDANNQEIAQSSNEFVDCMNEFFSQINKVLEPIEQVSVSLRNQDWFTPVYDEEEINND